MGAPDDLFKIDGVDGARSQHCDVPWWSLQCATNEESPSAMHPSAIGLDLTKHVFQLHRVMADGQVALRARRKPPGSFS
jgi:hypothetical protein